ncbi:MULTISPECIES: DUF2861 family protein [Vibrio]|uniref:DUF2861 family protein n=2 Tax=Vibrionaceae TaxID=641 RepID=UPI0002EA2AAB|nr:DUF2861 family protein [Vibrio tasmaniensis]OEF74435.1 hypothetical protein A162_18405 [Vibrio tasmaniensis 1F-155]PMO85087.1 hypothetical protein BCT01_24015 [Vibrio tasmaniensis]
MKVNSLTALFCTLPFTMPFACNAAWFTDTPLQHTYQSLLDDQPQVAWQELQIALDQQTLDSELWLPVKQEILSQTQCGTSLRQDTETKHHIQVSFIRRYGLSSQGYQIKVAAEQLSEDMKTQTQPISLVSPKGKVLLDGQLASNNEYQEIETGEMFIKPESGVYQLRIGSNHYPIVVALDNSKRWLTLESKLSEPHIVITPPKVIDNCPNANVSWQWFDENYNLLGYKVPIKTAQAPVPTESPLGTNAKHLSASVEMFEYQGTIEVQYVQRVTVPF